ncbi:MAG TPA: hypothetical protein VGM51_07190 [Armatimonadota bacterium]|jgi:hypothetical protein
MAEAAAAAALRQHLLRHGYVQLGSTVPYVIGRITGPSDPIYFSPRDQLKHLWAVGSSGSGKTNLNLNLITGTIASGRSVCVIDLRGDLVDRVLLWLAASVSPAALQRRLVLVDLRDEDRVVPMNPLVGDGEPYGRALFVLSVLRHEAESWGVQLEETLRNALIALAETGGSLLEVDALLSNPGYSQQVVAAVGDPLVREFFRRFWEITPAKRQEWRLPVLNKVTALLSIPRLRRMFGLRSCLPLGRLFDAGPGTILLVALAVDRLHEAAHLAGGLVVAAFQNAMMARADIPEAARIPVTLFVDEFETMATDRFEQVVAEGRRFGLGLVLSHQNLSQLPGKLRDAVRVNAATQLYFQTGAVDSSDLAREIVGGYNREVVQMDIIRQPVGQAYLVRRGQPSVKIRVPRYTDPAVSARQVAYTVSAGYTRFAVKKEAADAELEARRERQDAMRSEDPASGPRKDWEVRYARSELFEA